MWPKDEFEQIKDEEFEVVKQKIEKYLDEHSSDIIEKIKYYLVDINILPDITKDFEILDDYYIEYKGWEDKDYVFRAILDIEGFLPDSMINKTLKEKTKEAGLELTEEWIEEHSGALYEIYEDFYYSIIEEIEKEIDDISIDDFFEIISAGWTNDDWQDIYRMYHKRRY